MESTTILKLANLAMLLIFDAVVAAIIIILLVPLKRFKPATLAVLKRNFVGYFSNPTGYVFICVFMFLSSVAAFWPEEFFTSNLATLDQLNRWFPLIMLVFIPAITMSIWAEERHEHTDELLLTIPASDVDIVNGKYLAAVGIFTVSLLFSQLTNFMVMLRLAEGDLDVGLFIATYVGYWFIGIAMLALGMSASFLTSNLTVAFILGALFNAPLVFMSLIDWIIPGRGIAQSLSWWSYASRFADFGRGVVSSASTVFFVLVTVLGIYLSVILIGRRHWLGGRDGQSLLGHYLIRAVALGVIVLAASRFFAQHDWVRYDATTEQISSLSPDTKEILRNLKTDNTVLIEAFVSASVPEAYVSTKLDLITKLREFEALADADIVVRLYDNLEPFTEEAALADEKYGITPQSVTLLDRGKIDSEDIFMGAAFSCGLERVVIPFFDRGISAEYELVRSIATAANVTRRRIGIAETDAQLFGGFDMQRMTTRPKELIVTELEKQYEVEQVSLNEPVQEGKYDVLVVVQPSSLTQPQLNHLIAAVRNGQPTAMFEDPFPATTRSVPPTGEPKRPQGGMFGMGGGRQPEPKGDIRQLWNVLGIEMVGGPAQFGGLYDANIIWQRYNPYENKVNVLDITDEWVFAREEAPGANNEAFNDDDIVSSGLGEILFLFPGAIRNLGARELEFTPLVQTGDATGVISLEEWQANQMNPRRLTSVRKQKNKRYVLAARIKGYLKDDLTMSDAGAPLLAQTSGPPKPPPLSAANTEADAAETDLDDTPKAADQESAGQEAAAAADQREKEIHVIYVGDLDLLSSDFLRIRARPEEEINWQFENVTFVLNILDSLAGDESLVEIRKRKTRHSTLQLIANKTDDARTEAAEEIARFNQEFEEARDAGQAEVDTAMKAAQEKVDQLRESAQQQGSGMTRELMAAGTQLKVQQQRAQSKFDAQVDRLERERDEKLNKIKTRLEVEIRREQTKNKLQAALIPPIPPLLVGLLVWYLRRRREKEGVAESRLR